MHSSLRRTVSAKVVMLRWKCKTYSTGWAPAWDVVASSFASRRSASGRSGLVIPHPPLPVLFHPMLVVLIAVQHAALLQMAPVFEVRPRPPASGVDDSGGLLHRCKRAGACLHGKSIGWRVGRGWLWWLWLRHRVQDRGVTWPLCSAQSEEHFEAVSVPRRRQSLIPDMTVFTDVSRGVMKRWSGAVFACAHAILFHEKPFIKALVAWPTDSRQILASLS
jgi:hypothetical protein